MDELSILDVVRKEHYESSILLTYNASLPFYEQVVLPALRSRGCRRNIVLMDRRQCAVSWGCSTTRPSCAGMEYSLVPVAVPGAFHPKVLLLNGKQGSALWVGSHNLTLSGFGLNREITNYLTGPFPAGVGLEELYAGIRRWIGESPAHLGLLEALDSYFPQLDSSMDPTDWGLQFQGGASSLWDSVRDGIAKPPRRILVVGAFFDLEFGFLKQLRLQWPGIRIRVAIDVKTVSMAVPPSDLGVEWIDITSILEAPEGLQKRLHAKLVLFEGEGSWVVSGSANPSAPAWLTHHRNNAECMLLRRLSDAPAFLSTLGLGSVWDAPQLSLGVLATVSPIQDDRVSDRDDAKVLVGELRIRERIVLVHGVDEHNWASVEFRDSSDGFLWRGMPIFSGGGLSIPESLDVKRIRSLWLSAHEDGQTSRVMIHSPDNIRRLDMPPEHQRIQEILSNIEGGDDVAELVIAFERFLVEPLAGGSGGTASKAMEKTDADDDESVPESLEVAPQDRDEKAWKVWETGLIDILDVLSQRIVGNDDRDLIAEPGEESENSLPEGEEDASSPSMEHESRLAGIVRRKLRGMVRRHLTLRTLAQEDPERYQFWGRQAAILLLLAKELHRQQSKPRWKDAGLLLLDEEIHSELLVGSTLAVAHWPRLESSFLGICLWSCWVLGLDWQPPVRTGDMEEDPDLPWNRAILGLVLGATLSSSDWHCFRQLATGSVGDPASWERRHCMIAEWLSSAAIQGGVAGGPLRVGDPVLVPGEPRTTCVVSQNQGKKVVVLDFIHPCHGKNAFERILIPSVVRTLGPMPLAGS